jgi:succinoglycan biosynthesis transport protein ExoP
MVFGKKSKPVIPPASASASAPAAVSFAADGEPDMRALGRHLWQRRVSIFGVTLICAAAAFVVVNAITPQFRSESRLLLEAHQNVFLRADADKNADTTTIDPEAVTSQIQVVLSRDLARKVVNTMKLADKPEFDPAAAGASPLRALLGLVGIGRSPSAMSKEERTLEAFYDHLNVYAVEKSRVIAVDFSSANPDLAANVANAVAETYLQMQQTAKQDQTRAAGTWLAGEIDKMRKKVADAEAKVEQYRAKSNLFVGSNNTSLPAQQLSDLNAQIAAARGQQADLQARANQLRALIKSGKLIDSSFIANSETMRRLVDQRMTLRAQLAEQSTTLLDRHPRIQELRAQVAEIDRLIRSEGERLARQLDNDAVVAGDRIKTLTASLNQVKQNASQTNEQDVELRALEREAKTQRALLESYLVKYREASARDSINAAPPEARIISRASPALQPAYPKKLPIVLIAAFAGFALSAGFTVTGALLAAPGSSAAYGYGYTPVNYPTASYGTPAYEPPPMPVMPRTASPPLVPPNMPLSMPPMPPPASASYAAHAPLPLMAVSSVDEIVAQLRQAGDAGRRVAVIGAMHNVGTTFAAITLARTLAEGANVVLVDLAFSAPNLSVISTEPNAPGIAELIRGQASFGDIITRDQYSQVHLVATGDVGQDGPVLAASPMLATVIEALVRSYDHVVIDAGSAADSAVERLAPLATRAVLVTGDAAAPATRAARERMMMAGFADVSVLAGGAQAAAA